MPSSRKMEPSLTIVVVGTDGSSFSLNASMKPFLCESQSTIQIS